jgi:hypothetical protein
MRSHLRTLKNPGVNRKVVKLALRQPISRSHRNGHKQASQGAEAVISEANKIGPCAPYDFHSTNLTAYGGLLPVATKLEKVEFQQVVEETLMYQFVLATVLALYR